MRIVDEIYHLLQHENKNKFISSLSVVGLFEDRDS